MQKYGIEKEKVKNKVRCCCFDEGSLQVIGAKDLKFTIDPLRLIYIIYESRCLKGLVTYNTVRSKI